MALALDQKQTPLVARQQHTGWPCIPPKAPKAPQNDVFFHPRAAGQARTTVFRAGEVV